MENEFKQLGLNDEIVKSVTKMGFVKPTEVQKASIPFVLDGKDLIVKSKTGSGKTGAFGLPIIQQVDHSMKYPQALILSPTRELAVQVDEEIKQMGAFCGMKTSVVYGQHSIETEKKQLHSGVSVVTGTPGRVLDHLTHKRLKVDQIKYLVLDEADRMLDMGFYPQIVKIIKFIPKERMTLLFSATMPEDAKRIAGRYMNDPEIIEFASDTKTVDAIKQLYYRVERHEKRQQLERIIKAYQPESALIFCNTRDEVDRVTKSLQYHHLNVAGLHGAISQNKRMRTIDQFKAGKIRILVATDVAARGIHVDDLSLVINHDIPEDLDSYVHRIGRTGRAGHDGVAVNMVTADDIMTLYAIEEHVGKLIEEEPLPTDDYIAEKMLNANKALWKEPSNSRQETREKKSGHAHAETTRTKDKNGIKHTKDVKSTKHGKNAKEMMDAKAVNVSDHVKTNTVKPKHTPKPKDHTHYVADKSKERNRVPSRDESYQKRDDLKDVATMSREHKATSSSKSMKHTDFDMELVNKKLQARKEGKTLGLMGRILHKLGIK